jgi:hypothetical protein
MQPLWVSTLGQTPPETLLILYQTNHCTETEHGSSSCTHKSRYHLLLAVLLPIPIASNNSTNEPPGNAVSSSWTVASSSLQGGNLHNAGSAVLYLCSNHHVTALYTGQCHDDPYALIRDGVDLAAQLWQTTIATTTTSSSTRADSAKDPDKGDSLVLRDDATIPTTRNDTGTLLRHTLRWCSWNRSRVVV